MSGYAIKVQASNQVTVSEAPRKRSRWLYLPMLHPRYRAIQEFTEQAPDMTMPFLGAPADATTEEVRTLWLQSRKDAAAMVNIQTGPASSTIFLFSLGLPAAFFALIPLGIGLYTDFTGLWSLAILPSIFAISGIVMAAVLDNRTDKLSTEITSVLNGGVWQSKFLDAMQKVQKCAGSKVPVVIGTVASLLAEGNTARNRLNTLSPGDQVALMRLSTRMQEVSASRMAAGVELDGDTAELLHRAAAAMEPDENALARVHTKSPVLF